MPTVDAGIMRDPGLQAPIEAFGAAEGAALEGLGEGLAQAGDRQLTRQETIEAAHARNQFNREAEQELLRLSTEEDLSRAGVMERYGEFLAEKQTELIEQRGGRLNNRATLAADLEGLSSRYTGKASALSVRAGLAAVERSISESVNPLIAEAGRDPSRIDDLMMQADTVVARSAPALSPDAENSMRAAVRDQMAGAALDSVLMRGDADTAEQMLDMGLGDALTPQSASAVRRQIGTMRAEQQSLEREIAVAERALGRPLTQAEIAQKVGVAPPQGRTGASSPIGKIVEDRQRFVSQFGEDSQQVQAFDEMVAAETAGEGPDLSDVRGMRQEFTKLSGDFISVRDAFGKVRAAAEDPSAAGDVSLIFGFMKMIDPGSVVREGEFATAETAAGVPERIRGIYNRAISGERLTPEQREDFRRQSEKVFTSQSRMQRGLEEQFRGLAERSGVNPDQVVIDFFEGEEQPESPATEDFGEGEIVRNPETGERLILRGGEWVPYDG